MDRVVDARCGWDKVGELTLAGGRCALGGQQQGGHRFGNQGLGLVGKTKSIDGFLHVRARGADAGNHGHQCSRLQTFL